MSLSGKYANEILKKFYMESKKPMETPLTGNWIKEYDTSGEVVEATIYRHLVGVRKEKKQKYFLIPDNYL